MKLAVSTANAVCLRQSRPPALSADTVSRRLFACARASGAQHQSVGSSSELTRQHPSGARSASSSNANAKDNIKLMYTGKLATKVFRLKTFSIVSSLTLGASYWYAVSSKGFSTALSVVGVSFSPYLLSPLVIAWFFKRYVTRLEYNYATGTYAAHHYGLLTNKKVTSFDASQVRPSGIASMLNTFTVVSDGKRGQSETPFFLHDEDLVDVEAVGLYKKMVGMGEPSAGAQTAGERPSSGGQRAPPASQRQ